MKEINEIKRGEIYYATLDPIKGSEQGGIRPVLIIQNDVGNRYSKTVISSIENQTKYYTEKVEKTPNWNMYRIYSDEGKSGTSTKRREEFKQMINEAKMGRFDIILCASVSRFARNVSTCIEEVRQLKISNPNHPVGVYFETENIYTLDPESSQALSIHAMLAEWESDNKSRRMKLSYDQRICTGQYPVLDLLGYRHTADGDLVIEEDEAKTVRLIFLAYICGYSCQEIAEMLTEKKRKTLKGRTDWNASMVRSIMQNERRWGDLHARKTIVLDYAEKKIVKNNRIRDAAYVPSHHQGIVTPNIAKAAKYVNASGVSLTGGVPDVLVIPSGTLKGFISIQPVWTGIDNPSLDSICLSVYTKSEAEEFNNAISKYMDNEKGYFTPSSSCFISRSTPYITLTNKYLHFSKQLLNRFEHYEYFEVLFHPLKRIFAIRSCRNHCSNAIFVKGATLNSKGFMNVIFERMGWNPKLVHRLNGVTKRRGSETIVFFAREETLEYDDLKSYEIPPEAQFSMLNKPSVTISGNHFKFNMACVKLFKSVEYVIPMLSEEKKSLALIPCKEEEGSSVQWARLNKENRLVNREISSPDFVKSIFKTLLWDKKYRYKAVGRIVDSPRGLILRFDLKEAIWYTGEKIAYVDQKTGETKQKLAVYYPDKYEGRIGTSYSDFSKKRNDSQYDGLEGYAQTSLLDASEASHSDT